MKEESLNLLDEINSTILENKTTLEILVSYCDNNPEKQLVDIAELLRQVLTKQKKALTDSNKFSGDLYKYLFKVS